MRALYLSDSQPELTGICRLFVSWLCLYTPMNIGKIMIDISNGSMEAALDVGDCHPAQGNRFEQAR
jgi:hypothetical protein